MATEQLRDSRKFAFNFLFQCDSERMNYFSEPHFQFFTENFEAPKDIIPRCRIFCEGTLSNLHKIDEMISKNSKDWSIERLPATDRAILRMAVWELLESDTPTKVILNEAIELAKKYGTEDSARFVNGVLDTSAKVIRSK